MNGRARKLEADRHRDETGAHDAVIGGEIFRAIGGEDGHSLPARKATRGKRAGDVVSHGVELAVADLAREPAAEIDDRDLVEIAIARDEIAEVGERGHRSQLYPHHVARSTARRFADRAPHRAPLPACGERELTESEAASVAYAEPLSLRRRREIGAAAAGDQLALRIEHLRLRGRELTSHAHDLAADGEVPGHGHGMIVDVQVDGGHAGAGLLDHGPVAAEIDQRGENAAVAIAPVWIDPPLLPPRRLQFDSVVIERDDFEAKPLMIRGAGNERLHALERDLFAHGATTTLPMTSRSWIRRSPSRASASGSTLSITGRILPSAMSPIKARRSSS